MVKETEISVAQRLGNDDDGVTVTKGHIVDRRLSHALWVVLHREVLVTRTAGKYSLTERTLVVALH